MTCNIKLKYWNTLTKIFPGWDAIFTATGATACAQHGWLVEWQNNIQHKVLPNFPRLLGTENLVPLWIDKFTIVKSVSDQGETSIAEYNCLGWFNSGLNFPVILTQISRNKDKLFYVCFISIDCLFNYTFLLSRSLSLSLLSYKDSALWYIIL